MMADLPSQLPKKWLLCRTWGDDAGLLNADGRRLTLSFLALEDGESPAKE